MSGLAGSRMALAHFVTALTMATWFTNAAASDGCIHHVVARAADQDRRWHAIVDEATCVGDDVTATVRVTRAAAGAPTVDVLGIDTGGHEEDRPRLAWSSSGVLDVTVPNLSFLKVLTLSPDGARVRLHFHPDDPASRAAWLKAHGFAEE